MKKLEPQLKEFMVKELRARERRNKIKAVAHILRTNHPVLKQLVPEVLQLIVDETIALERYWRKILSECPELRGSDYKTKKIVVQRKQIELGYESQVLVEDFERALDK